MIDEKLLIKQLQDRSLKEIAFKTCVDEYKRCLYWHIRKIVYLHEDANDVVQNTFIKVYKNIDSFKGNSKLYSWLYRIATNEAISFINKKAKEQNLDITDYQQQITSNLSSDYWFDGDEIQLILQKAIATLPQQQQLVFNMKYFDEMKYNDISEILSVSVGSLKASYHHAVKKIERYIKSIN
ncbi:RNA polymerase sigma factor [Tenacibaculum sp. C7A-26P2]|uniref:RNA polymerase sigma factor n=1 Tax=Tenacibaculum sp. C7A-26P2 TaxID=3447504 RepID=UPI003F838CAD